MHMGAVKFSVVRIKCDGGTTGLLQRKRSMGRAGGVIYIKEGRMGFCVVLFTCRIYARQKSLFGSNIYSWDQHNYYQHNKMNSLLPILPEEPSWLY